MLQATVCDGVALDAVLFCENRLEPAGRAISLMVGPAVKREAVAHLQPVMGLFPPRGEGDWDYVFDAASVELMAMAKLV